MEMAVFGIWFSQDHRPVSLREHQQTRLAAALQTNTGDRGRKRRKPMAGGHPASVAVQAFVKSFHCNSPDYIAFFY